MVNWKITFVIFGIPISLLILTLSIFFMINLTNVTDVLNSTTIPENIHNITHFSFDIGIFLGLVFGLFYCSCCNMVWIWR